MGRGAGRNRVSDAGHAGQVPFGVLGWAPFGDPGASTKRPRPLLLPAPGRSFMT
jgi:hypothetical protein